MLYEVGDEALVDVTWNADVPEARSWASAVRFDLEHPPPLRSWSYGFSANPGSTWFGDWGGQRVQFLGPMPDGSPGANVYEVSPVLVAAGIGTRTLAADTGPSGGGHAGAEDLAAAEAIAAQYDSDAAELATNEYARFIGSGLRMAS